MELIDFKYIDNFGDLESKIKIDFVNSKSSRIYLRKLERISQLAEDKLRNVFRRFPLFSGHGIEHAYSVVTYLNVLTQIVKEITDPLNYKELYYLYSAGFLHDIALSVPDKGSPLERECNNAAKYLKALNIFDERYSSTNWQRTYHHKFAPEMIKKMFMGDAKFKKLTGRNLKKDIRIIGLISEGHRRAPLDDDKYMSSPHIRLRTLIVLLRIADAMDLTSRRIKSQEKLYEFFSDSMTSNDLAHWVKHANVIKFELLKEKKSYGLILHIKPTLAIPKDLKYKTDIIEFLKQPFHLVDKDIDSVFNAKLTLCFNPDSCQKCKYELSKKDWDTVIDKMKSHGKSEKVIINAVHTIIHGRGRIPYTLKYFIDFKKRDDWAVIVGDRNLYPPMKEEKLKRTASPMDLFPIIKSGLGRNLSVYSDKIILNDPNLIKGKHIIIVGGNLVNLLSRKANRETIFKFTLSGSAFNSLFKIDLPALFNVKKIPNKEITRIKKVLRNEGCWKDIISKDILFTEKYYKILSEYKNQLDIISPFKTEPIKPFFRGPINCEYRGILSLCNHPISINKMAIICAGTYFISTIGILNFLFSSSKNELQKRPLGGILSTYSHRAPDDYDSHIVLDDYSSEWNTKSYTVASLKQCFHKMLISGEYLKHDYAPEVLNNFLTSLNRIQK